MGILILITVLVVIFYLGRHAIREGQRIEQQKKFMKNMNNYGNSGRSENDPASIWNKHKRGK
jgi:uncharacterized protein YxeA